MKVTHFFVHCLPLCTGWVTLRHFVSSQRQAHLQRDQRKHRR
jgi:hypothetical protein